MLGDNFLWGVANSAFQVEGSPEPSDWLDWTSKVQNIKDASNANKLIDFWNNYAEEIEWAEKLGAKAFRLSIAWERVCPNQDEFSALALNRYVEIIRLLQSKNIEPVLTLHHFVTPKWLADKGVCLAPDFAEHFAKYTQFVLDHFEKEDVEIKYWITINEPMVVAHLGYMAGVFPPGLKNEADMCMQVVEALCSAHRKAYKIIKKMLPDSMVSFAKHVRVFHPKRVLNPADQLLAKISDWSFNSQFLNAACSSKKNFWIPGAKKKSGEWNDEQDSTLDYLALNYYGRFMVQAKLTAPYVDIVEGPGRKSDIGWEIYPEGLYTSLTKLYKKYNLPVFVTENGIADRRDLERVDFLKEHIAQLALLKSEGVPLLGYLYWSLTDNFEWSEGVSQKFGLIEYDYKTGQRSARRSFAVYKDIISKF